MNYRKTKDKWVISKNGVYMSLSDDELLELELIINDIKSGKKQFYAEDARTGKAIQETIDHHPV
jgi:hypothetical protein